MKKGIYAVLSLVVALLLTAFFLPERAGEETGEKRFFGIMNAMFAREEEKPLEDNEKVIRVYMTKDREIVSLPLEQYVAGVVASEMPMSYHMQALCAQAVAARSYAVFKSGLYSGEGCLSHPGADVCSSSGCCQGYVFPDDEQYKNALKAAKETENLVALFRSHPIRALYHACSGGYTEDSENVYSQALAYLRGVPSPGEEEHSRYEGSVTLSVSDLKEAFSDNDEILFLDDYPLSGQLEILSRTQAGRVKKIRVGLSGMDAASFRRASGIGSSNFEMVFDDENARVTFLTRGYGHGVGMSQAGAQAMAKEGWDYQKILRHYYTGIEIDRIERIEKEE